MKYISILLITFTIILLMIECNNNQKYDWKHNIELTYYNNSVEIIQLTCDDISTYERFEDGCLSLCRNKICGVRSYKILNVKRIPEVNNFKTSTTKTRQK